MLFLIFYSFAAIILSKLYVWKIYTHSFRFKARESYHRAHTSFWHQWTAKLWVYLIFCIYYLFLIDATFLLSNELEQFFQIEFIWSPGPYSVLTPITEILCLFLLVGSLARLLAWAINKRYRLKKNESLLLVLIILAAISYILKNTYYYILSFQDISPYNQFVLYLNQPAWLATLLQHSVTNNIFFENTFKTLYVLLFFLIILLSLKTYLCYYLISPIWHIYNIFFIKEWNSEKKKKNKNDEMNIFYSPKQWFDSFRCLDCGLCNQVCPPHLLGQELRPSQVVMDLRNQFEKRKKSGTLAIAKSNFFENQCIACKACDSACPIGINPLSFIYSKKAEKQIK